MPNSYEEKKSKLTVLMDTARKNPARLQQIGDRLLLNILEEMERRIDAQDSAVGNLNARTIGSVRIG